MNNILKILWTISIYKLLLSDYYRTMDKAIFCVFVLFNKILFYKTVLLRYNVVIITEENWIKSYKLTQIISFINSGMFLNTNIYTHPD